MAELKRSDIAEEGAIKVPLEIADNVDKLVASLDKYAATAKETIGVSNAEAQSLTKVGEQTKKLSAINEDLAKTHTELVTSAKKQQEQTDRVAKSSAKYTSETIKLRNEIKAAKDEAIKLGKELGTDSQAFVDAAAKAGQLQDELNAVSDAVKLVSASPFENISAQMRDVGTQLLNLNFGGAATAAKQFAATSRTITFKEAAAGLKDFGSTLLNLGKGILANPLFLLVGVFTAIAFAAIKFKDSIKPVAFVFDLVGDSIDWVIGKLKDFTDWLGFSTFAKDEKTKNTVDNAQKEIDAVTKRYEREIALADASGKETIDIERQKYEAIKKSALLGVQALQEKVKEGRKLTDEEILQKGELIKAYQDADLAINISQTKAEAERKKILDEALRKRLDAIMKNHDATMKAFVKFEASTYKRLIAENDKEEKLYEDKIKSIQGSYNKQFEITKQHLAKLGELLKSEEQKDYERRQKEIADLKEGLEESLYWLEQYSNAAINFSNAIAERRLMNIELERRKLDEFYKEEIEKAGDNKEAKALLEEEYAERQKELERQSLQERRRAATFEKALAIAQATIKGIVATLEGLLKGGPPLALAYGALAAAQLAAIIATPIPQFEKGTMFSPEGPAIINEAGPELLVENGRAKMYDSKGAILTHLKRGTKVIPADITDQIIRGGLIDGFRQTASVNGVDLLEEIKGLRSDLRGKEANNYVPDVVRIGNDLFDVRKFRDGSKQLRKIRIMGR